MMCQKNNCAFRFIFGRHIFIVLIILSLFVLSSQNVSAGIFSVGVTITGSCTSDWQCTAFSENDCGVRDCIDINACSIATDEPLEFIECERSNTGSGNDDSPDEVLPDDSWPDFYIPSEIVKIESVHGEKSEYSIMISSKKEYSYFLSLSSSNADFLKIVSLSRDSFEGDGEFDVLVDASNFSSGVYSGSLIVDNGYKQKKITLVIHIYSNAPKFNIDLNNIKILDSSTVLAPVITFESDNLSAENITLTYSLLSSNGVELFNFISTNIDSSSVVLPMPSNLERGYYVLAVTANSASGSNTQYSTLYADPEHTLSPYVEETKNITYLKNTSIFIWVGILIILIIVAFLIYILRDKIFSKDNYSKIMLQVYEEGFITKKEYDGFTGKKFNSSSVETTIVNVSNTVIGVKKIKYSSQDFSKKCLSGKEFIARDGTRMHSIKELFDSINSMNEQVFYHHVNSERNDFANWINDVFEEKDLASQIRVVRTKEEMRKIIAEFDKS